MKKAARYYFKHGHQGRLPKGAKFDLSRNQWYVAASPWDRPLFDSLLTGQNLPWNYRLPPPDGEFVTIWADDKHDVISMPEFELIANGAIHHSPGQTFITGPGVVPGCFLSGRAESPLKASEVGLIVPPAIEVGEDGRAKYTRGLDLSETRTALLLWDRLDWPEIVSVSGPVDSDIQLLIDQGFIVRSQVKLLGHVHQISGLLELGDVVFNLAENSEPGRWAVGQGQSAITDMSNDGNRALLVRLQNALAIPDANVPLADLLEFRENRRSELIALRHYIQEVYQSIRGAPDRPLAEIAAIQKLESAVSAQRRVAQEAGWTSRLASLSGSLKITDFGAGFAAASTAFQASGNIWMAASAGIGALSLTAKFSAPKKSLAASHFDYVISTDRLAKSAQV